MQGAEDKGSGQQAPRQERAGCVGGTERNPRKHNVQEVRELDTARIRKLLKARERSVGWLQAPEGT